MDGLATARDGSVAARVSGLIAYKMTGSGNDFVMLDGRTVNRDTWSAAVTRTLCDRRMGMGADAVVLVAPGSARHRIRMTYFNSDGSPAPMCGNAALCSVQLARRLEMIGEGTVVLETEAGAYEVACCGEDRGRLCLGKVEAPASISAQDLGPGESRGARLCVGVPHLVVLVSDVEAVDVEGRGRAWRFHRAAGVEGANVNFVARAASRGTRWAMRTYERGIEAETHACATGAAAAAAALRAWGESELPTEFVTRTGLILRLDGRPVDGNGLEDVWVEGEARHVYRAVVDLP